MKSLSTLNTVKLTLKPALAMAALLLALPASSFAQQQGPASTLNYTWAEIDIVRLNIDQVGGRATFMRTLDQAEGFGIRGSYEFAPRWFGFAGYSMTKADVNFSTQEGLFFGTSTDVTRLDLGLGHYMPINNSTDAVFRIAYTDFERDRFRFAGTGGPDSRALGNNSSDGYFIDGSIRSQLDQRIEGSLGLRYTDISHTDSVGLIGGLLFEFTPVFSVVFEVEAASDIDHWLLGVRYNF
jgi:hypothetical protein